MARRYHLAWFARHAVLLLWEAIMLFPSFWMVSTSFKNAGEWIAWPPYWLPHQPTLYNYEQILAFTPSGMGSNTSARHAFTIAISRFQVGGKNFRYAVLIIRMIPPIVIAIPILMYYAILIPYTTEALLGVRLSLFDTYIGLGLLYVWPCLQW